MIGVATVVISYQQMNNAKEQREQDIFLANQSRAQQFEIEERLAADINYMDTVLENFLREMANLLLSPNFTRTDVVTASVVRARTLMVLPFKVLHLPMFHSSIVACAVQVSLAHVLITYRSFKAI
jgi:hypothetical protein